MRSGGRGIKTTGACQMALENGNLRIPETVLGHKSNSCTSLFTRWSSSLALSRYSVSTWSGTPRPPFLTLKWIQLSERLLGACRINLTVFRTSLRSQHSNETVVLTKASRYLHLGSIKHRRISTFCCGFNYFYPTKRSRSSRNRLLVALPTPAAPTRTPRYLVVDSAPGTWRGTVPIFRNCSVKTVTCLLPFTFSRPNTQDFLGLMERPCSSIKTLVVLNKFMIYHLATPKLGRDRPKRPI